MRKYSDEDDRKLEQVICNACGREMKLENDILRGGCFCSDSVFGYFSRKDGMRHRFDLCEDCYDKMVEKFKVPVEETEARELL